VNRATLLCTDSVFFIQPAVCGSHTVGYTTQLDVRTTYLTSMLILYFGIAYIKVCPNEIKRTVGSAADIFCVFAGPPRASVGPGADHFPAPSTSPPLSPSPSPPPTLPPSPPLLFFPRLPSLLPSPLPLSSFSFPPLPSLRSRAFKSS